MKKKKTHPVWFFPRYPCVKFHFDSRRSANEYSHKDPVNNRKLTRNEERSSCKFINYTHEYFYTKLPVNVKNSREVWKHPANRNIYNFCQRNWGNGCCIIVMFTCFAPGAREIFLTYISSLRRDLWCEELVLLWFCPNIFLTLVWKIWKHIQRAQL